MQKKLLTLAVASALGAPGVALAQSSVEVYGTIRVAVGTFNYGGIANIAGQSKWDLSSGGASNWGLRGRESVGGGLTAWFQVETDAPLERSNAQLIKPASRNSAVGFQGSWGNAFVGQWTTPWADLDGLWNVGAVGFWGPVTSIIGRRSTTGTAPNANCANLLPLPGAGLGVTPGGSAVCDAIEGGGGQGHPFWRRISNSVFYQSPVFSGAQFKLGAQMNEGRSIQGIGGSSTGANASMWSSSIEWAGMSGKARVGLAIDRHKDFTTTGKTDTGWAVKGGWNFGVVDVGLALEHMTYQAAATDSKARQWGIALDVPLGSGSLKGSFSKAAALSNAANTGAKQYNFGYEHRFSKRTNVGIGYAKVDNETGAAFTWANAPPNQVGTSSNNPIIGSDVRTVFLSIRHRF